jgi:hypothetical protein
MFNRFFCFLFLAIMGLNLTLSNLKLKAQEANLQKPYISEVWHGNSDYSDKCTSSEIKSENAVGYCAMDTWIEITNPTETAVSLTGYSIDATTNRGFVEQGECDELDLENTKDKKTNTLLCQPTKIQDKAILEQTVLPNSQVLFQQKYGTIINMLTRAGFSATKLDLVRRGATTSFYSLSLIDNDGKVIDTFSSNFGGNSTVQLCFDDNGYKVQRNSTKAFQAGEKLFYGTPGQPNDCPEVQVQIPVIPPPTLENPKPDQSPVQEIVSEQKVPEIIEQKQSILEPISELVQKDLNLQKPEPLDVPSQILQSNPSPPLPIATIEIKTEAEPKIEKTEPESFKVQEQIEPTKAKVDKATEQEITNIIKIEKELDQAEAIKPTIEYSNLDKPSLKQNIVEIPTTKEFLIKSTPILDDQIKVVSVKDELQSEIFGKDILRPATVDMYIVKVNFVYFNLALILYLLSKTFIENRRHIAELCAIARAKIFGAN